MNLRVDGTRIRVPGDDEGQTREHGVQGRRQRCKVGLALDTTTSDIRALELTPGSDGDSAILPTLLDLVPEGGTSAR